MTETKTKQEEIREMVKGFLEGTAHNGYYAGLEDRFIEDLSEKGAVIKGTARYIGGDLAVYYAVEPLVAPE